MAQVIKRGILQSFDSSTYTASVLLLEATSTFLAGVPCSATIDGTSAIPGAFCAVLFFDEHNVRDAVLLALYPNGGQGVPAPPPGRVTFLATYQQANATVINAGVTTTLTLVGGGSNLPSGVLGVLFSAFFTSPTADAYVQIAPHGGSLNSYISLGRLAVANSYVNGNGLVPVDGAGKIDIKANTGTCTLTLYTYGYVI